MRRIVETRFSQGHPGFLPTEKKRSFENKCHTGERLSDINAAKKQKNRAIPGP